jgi:hypothetical protein
MRFAAMQRPQERAAGRRRLVETRRQDGWIFAPYRTPACVQWSKLQGYGECLVKRASYMQRKAVGTVGTENDADKRHRKTTVDNNICTTQPGQEPGRQAHMGNNNNMLKGCCSSLLASPPAATRCGTRGLSRLKDVYWSGPRHEACATKAEGAGRQPIGWVFLDLHQHKTTNGGLMCVCEESPMTGRVCGVAFLSSNN